MTKQWWKESVVYQIYPRSFKDSNGDGIGDLQGVIQKLDYLKDLGVDVLWLCPVYDSPNADNGYDIRDYRAIMKEFGTMQDFDELLVQAHQRNLKIVLDLVVNHTSDEHEWFQKSRMTPKNKYRDYYIWKDGKNGAEPTNWAATFGGSAWKYDESVKKYYLHLFAEKQPDLNWENDEVRMEIYDMMRWWLDKGVDGFRMDVINGISKDQRFPDGETLPGKEYVSGWKYTSNGPRVHEFLQEMNREVLSRYDIMTVGETGGVTTEDALNYAGNNRHELNMIFQFEHVDLGADENGKWNDTPVPLDKFKAIITRWQTRLDGKAWNSLYLGNHDQPRSVSRFGNDGKYRVESAKLLATLLFTLQGTPYIYQGEELGMTNVQFDSIEQYRDIETLNIYKEFVDRNPADKEKIMRYIHAKGRDNARTPMQWNNTSNAGFTVGIPWIQVNPNYVEINAAESLSDPNSILNNYKKLIKMRREYPVMVYGHYIPLLKEHDKIFSYLRQLEDQTLLVILNFSETSTKVELPPEAIAAGSRRILSNYQDMQNESVHEIMEFAPFEADVYLLNQMD